MPISDSADSIRGEFMENSDLLEMNRRSELNGLLTVQ